MKRPLGIVFDFGDTLVQDETFSPLNGYARMLELASGVDGLTARQLVDATDALVLDINHRKFESMLEMNFQSYLRLAFGRLGISFDISFDELEREFWDAAVVHYPADGVFEVLDWLDTNGIKAGVLSNISFCGDVLAYDLAKLGFTNRFDFIIASSDYGFRKPSPYIFEIAVRRLGLAPGDIWFAGDRLDYDIAGAAKAGLFPVWYNRKGTVNEDRLPCLEIKSWSEFRGQLESRCGNG